MKICFGKEKNFYYQYVWGDRIFEVVGFGQFLKIRGEEGRKDRYRDGVVDIAKKVIFLIIG